MSTQTLYRWGAITTIVTALLFVAAAVACQCVGQRPVVVRTEYRLSKFY